jgi:hypothetical protein
MYRSEDPNHNALLNQMLIDSHLVRQLAEKDAYVDSLKEQRPEAANLRTSLPT